VIAWIETLGPVAWPLFACSLLGVAVLLERLWFYLRTARPPLSQQRLIEAVGFVDPASSDPRVLEADLAAKHHPWLAGFSLLLQHASYPRALREEVVNLWLAEQRSLHASNLRWLTIVAVISPLLGLLGTVLGMIESFAALVAHTGPVQPAVLAGGLQQAMFTTAVGLIIAVPALTAAHVFRLWGDARIERLQRLLNHVHLAIEGVGCAAQPGGPRPPGSLAAAGTEAPA